MRTVGASVLSALMATVACIAGDDVCLLPPDPGPCDGICPRWHFDDATAHCVPFEYGCCGGNANNFISELQCQAHCGCVLPPDPGPCDGACERWYFDVEAGGCRTFIWGCCGGNANNFETREACELACAGACPADVTLSGVVDVDDLLAVLSGWGQPGGAGDVNRDGAVDVDDLVAVLLAWGPCG